MLLKPCGIPANQLPLSCRSRSHVRLQFRGCCGRSRPLSCATVTRQLWGTYILSASGLHLAPRPAHGRGCKRRLARSRVFIHPSVDPQTWLPYTRLESLTLDAGMHHHLVIVNNAMTDAAGGIALSPHHVDSQYARRYILLAAR